MSRTGRPRILEKRGIPPMKVVRAYQMTKSVRRAAALLHIGYTKVWMVLKEQNVERQPVGMQAKYRYNGGRVGAVKMYAKKHPGVVLPTDSAALAALVGCSRGAARWYLKMYMKPLYSMAKRLTDLRTANVALRSENGKLIAMRDVLNYRVHVERRVCSLRIDCLLKSGQEERFVIRSTDLPSLSALIFTANPSLSVLPSD